MKLRVFITCGLALLLTLGIWAVAGRDPLRTEQRRAWKNKAVEDISKLADDPEWPTRERATLKKGDTAEIYEAWLSKRMILMKNGDWLAYANTCQKEDGSIADIFLGRGSDGQWYYSTYHFCKGMVVLRMEDQPKNLVEFVKTHYLHPFDGHSDESLSKTWPPAR